MSISQVTQPALDFAKLSSAKLQKQLKQCWVRFEKAVKNEMAPRLYYLRKKLKRPGDRHDRGFNKWVEGNLGLSISTVNRWANQYAIAQGFKKSRSAVTQSKRTSSQMKRGSKEQYDVHLLFTPKRQREFERAWGILGDKVASDLIFETIV